MMNITQDIRHGQQISAMDMIIGQTDMLQTQTRTTESLEESISNSWRRFCHKTSMTCVCLHQNDLRTSENASYSISTLSIDFFNHASFNDMNVTSNIQLSCNSVMVFN